MTSAAKPRARRAPAKVTAPVVALTLADVVSAVGQHLGVPAVATVDARFNTAAGQIFDGGRSLVWVLQQLQADVLDMHRVDVTALCVLALTLVQLHAAAVGCSESEVLARAVVMAAGGGE